MQTDSGHQIGRRSSSQSGFSETQSSKGTIHRHNVEKTSAGVEEYSSCFKMLSYHSHLWTQSAPESKLVRSELVGFFEVVGVLPQVAKKSGDLTWTYGKWVMVLAYMICNASPHIPHSHDMWPSAIKATWMITTPTMHNCKTDFMKHSIREVDVIINKAREMIDKMYEMMDGTWDECDETRTNLLKQIIHLSWGMTNVRMSWLWRRHDLHFKKKKSNQNLFQNYIFQTPKLAIRFATLWKL